ncbi:MAG: N-acetylneuraminate synthase family protein [Patescibacteria group bacterium]
MKKNPEIRIGKRRIGVDYPPLVIAEIGINHEGSMKKAKRMIDDAHVAGCEIAKFQSHILEDEMVPVARNIVPGNADVSIWDIMARCAFSETEERELKAYVESKGMMYLCTPFSRAAADRLKKIGVVAYKIGSGECNNYPLVEHIAKFGKPIILSTGMNDIRAIAQSVKIFHTYKTPYALLHCTSMYPTPYREVRYGAIAQMRKAFPDAVLGLSDHSLGIWTCLGAVALGASILEKHFTSDMKWSGPDIEISLDPTGLCNMIIGSRAIWEARGGEKRILKKEKPTIDFAYATVVTIADVKRGEKFTMKNLWVKRPGTGKILAEQFPKILGKRATQNIAKDVQLTPKMFR